ncbi:VOC family protein [Xanthobacter sediminis]
MPIRPTPVTTAKTVNHIAISVSDLKRSRDWYCRMFGLHVIQDTEESVLLGFGESMLVLRKEGTPGTISHFMFGIDGYDAAALAAALAAEGLEPQKDSDSFHVRDPDGLNVQVGDRGLGLGSGIVENGFKMK